jgi:hypothetical protein
MSLVLDYPAPHRSHAEARWPIGYTIIGASLVSGVMWVGLIVGAVRLIG